MAMSAFTPNSGHRRRPQDITFVLLKHLQIIPDNPPYLNQTAVESGKGQSEARLVITDARRLLTMAGFRAAVRRDGNSD